MTLTRRVAEKGPGSRKAIRPFRVAALTEYLTPYQMSKIVVTESGCWLWTGSTNNRGYSTIWYKQKCWTGHKLTCHLLGVEIPEGMRGDHQCHTSDCRLGDNCPHRACINPEHIKAATDAENYARSARLASQREETHCPNNHEYTPENTGRKPNGSRRCKTCSRENTRRARAKKSNLSVC